MNIKEFDKFVKSHPDIKYPSKVSNIDTRGYGPQLQYFVSRYGVISFGSYEFDARKNDSYVESIGYVVIRDIGNGDFDVVDADDNVYEYWHDSENSIRPKKPKVKLFDYIVSTYNSSANESYSYYDDFDERIEELSAAIESLTKINNGIRNRLIGNFYTDPIPPSNHTTTTEEYPRSQTIKLGRFNVLMEMGTDWEMISNGRHKSDQATSDGIRIAELIKRNTKRIYDTILQELENYAVEWYNEYKYEDFVIPFERGKDNIEDFINPRNIEIAVNGNRISRFKDANWRLYVETKQDPDHGVCIVFKDLKCLGRDVL